MEIRFYTTARGERPVERFIEAQPERLRAAIVDALDLLSRDAPDVSLRQIRGRLWEIRVSAGAAARIFYCAIEAGDACILLHAYRKQTQKAPAREIAVAERRLREVLE